MSNARFGLRTRTGEVSSLIQGLSSTDQDVVAFITATGITDLTQQAAIFQLVFDLKQFGIWTKMKAIYPFLGGTATTHKFNLKDPQDTNAAYRLDFIGGWTHSNDGAQPNGTNAYANTYISASNELNINSACINTYINTTPNNGVLIGNGVSTCFIQVSNNTFFASLASSFSQIAKNNTTGFYLITRNSSTVQSLFFNNNLLLSDNKNSSSYSANNILLGAYTPTQQFSNARQAFTAIGDGLTTTEVGDLYTAVQTYQTTLNRNV